MRSFNQFLGESKISLKKHKTLRPELFDLKSGKLKPEVRRQLLKIGKAWAEWAEVPEAAIIRYDLVGSSINYLYHKESDLDLHIICDLSKISKCEDTLRDYLRKAKSVWEYEHNITIYGIDVECYCEDKDDPAPALQARYDLSSNEWINEPNRDRIPDIKDREIRIKAEIIEDQIDQMIEDGVDNEAVLEKLKNKVLNLRKNSIKEGGEFAFENLTYKVIRADGYLDKLDRYMRGIQDQDLSLYK